MEEPENPINAHRLLSEALPTNSSTSNELSNLSRIYMDVMTINASKLLSNGKIGLLMQCALNVHDGIHGNVELLNESDNMHTEDIHSLDGLIPKSIIDEIEQIGDVDTHIETLDHLMFMGQAGDNPVPLSSRFDSVNLHSVSPHLTFPSSSIGSQTSRLVSRGVMGIYEHDNLPSQLVATEGSMFNESQFTYNDDTYQFKNGRATNSQFQYAHSHGSQFSIPTGPAALTSQTKENSVASNDNYSIGSDMGCQALSWELYDLCEKIWRQNDQKASLYLQERIKACIPGEYEVLVNIIHEQTNMLMVHRFGNFLVQCMLSTANAEDIEKFASKIIGNISQLAMNQFCCHVIQKLLEVGPLVVQARVAAELLDEVYDTMTSPFGTHVWQKLLQLPWSKRLPPLGSMAHNAVRQKLPENGWISIAQTEAGCSSIRSYLCLNQKESAACANDLLDGLHELMTCNINTGPVICKLAMLNSTRARTMTLIFSRAYEYSKHPIGSEILVQLLRLRIPSFPSRFSAAITSHRLRMQQDKYASNVLDALNSAQGLNKI